MPRKHCSELPEEKVLLRMCSMTKGKASVLMPEMLLERWLAERRHDTERSSLGRNASTPVAKHMPSTSMCCTCCLSPGCLSDFSSRPIYRDWNADAVALQARKSISQLKAAQMRGNDLVAVSVKLLSRFKDLKR